MSGTGSDPRTEVVRELLARITAREFDRIGEMLCDDVVFDVAYFPDDAASLQNPVRGRAAVQETFATVVAGMFDPFVFSLDASYPGVDPEVVVVEYSTTGTATPTGRPYANRYAGIMRVRDGRLAFWREYHNPEQMVKSFGSTSG